LLAADSWSEAGVGSGAILQHTIDAIEIQDSQSDRTNNLVFWQNRFGHANREHRALLEATTNPRLRRELEQLLFGLYRESSGEAAIFDRLSELTGAKYPLLAYLFFLKDIERFMPIQPTGFDRAFRALSIDFSTLRQCSWENYAAFNTILADLRLVIGAAAALKDVRLIDAHSFCWIFATLLRREAEGTLGNRGGRMDAGRVLSGREKSSPGKPRLADRHAFGADHARRPLAGRDSAAVKTHIIAFALKNEIDVRSFDLRRDRQPTPGFRLPIQPVPFETSRRFGLLDGQSDLADHALETEPLEYRRRPATEQLAPDQQGFGFVDLHPRHGSGRTVDSPVDAFQLDRLKKRPRHLIDPHPGTAFPGKELQSPVDHPGEDMPFKWGRQYQHNDPQKDPAPAATPFPRSRFGFCRRGRRGRG
jgi:hypothetical protein